MSLDDQLAELWAAGETLTQIGRQVGASRGAVAGRLSRARKAGDSRFSARPPKPRSDNSCKRRRTPQEARRRPFRRPRQSRSQ